MSLEGRKQLKTQGQGICCPCIPAIRLGRSEGRRYRLIRPPGRCSSSWCTFRKGAYCAHDHLIASEIDHQTSGRIPHRSALVFPAHLRRDAEQPFGRGRREAGPVDGVRSLRSLADGGKPRQRGRASQYWHFVTPFCHTESKKSFFSMVVVRI